MEVVRLAGAARVSKPGVASARIVAPDGRSDLAGPLAALARAGTLRAVLPPSQGGCALGTAPEKARTLCDLLRRVGRADLSLARLFEGHVNAARLVETHGGPEVRGAMRDAVMDGAVLGVWGADGPEPLEWVALPGGRVRLEGKKRFASGLGLVTHAILTARAGAGAPQRMFLVPVTEADRHDPGAWTASAMRATASGGFDATGLELGPEAAVGGPSDMTIEPHFEGGTWRYCAAHVGGAEGLIEGWIQHLRRTGRTEDPVQRHRLGQALAAVIGARASVEMAADMVEGSVGAGADRIGAAVTSALLAREAVERACVEILALAERALGMAAHDGRSPLDRMRRDLSLFLRQAAPDSKLDRAVGDVLARGGLVGTLR